LGETQEIAEQYGFVHPTDSKTPQAVVMTKDFLITLKQRDLELEHACAIKPAVDLRSQNSIFGRLNIRIVQQKIGASGSTKALKTLQICPIEDSFHALLMEFWKGDSAHHNPITEGCTAFDDGDNALGGVPKLSPKASQF